MEVKCKWGLGVTGDISYSWLVGNEERQLSALMEAIA